MYNRLEEQTLIAKKQPNPSNTAFVEKLELISVPVGTWAGTQDRVIRIRDGQRIPADTGDQGGGQN
jgi:hypothetical protein